MERTDLTPSKDRNKDGRALFTGSFTQHKDRIDMKRTGFLLPLRTGTG